MKNKLAALAVLAIIVTGLACSSDDTGKANELVAEANKFVTEANKAASDATSKGGEYDKKVDNVKNDDDLKAARDFGKEMTKLYTSMEENFKKASEKFDEASKLKVNEKFKEYLETKAKEMKNRSETATEMKKIPKALDDAANEKAYRDALQDLVPKIQKMTKESQEIGDKADKIVKDNPTIIKQN